MSEAVSCGGVVIFRGKVLVLYKNFMNSRDGWVLPKGTVEKGETYEQTAVREVNEELTLAVRIIHLRLDTRILIRSFTGICVNPTAMTVCLRKKNFFTMQVTISITRRIIFWNIRMRNRYFQMLIQCIDN